jgi:L-methionine (R)-S-oxide reductase
VTRRERYAELRGRLDALLEGEDDWIAALATIVCELHSAFDYYDWTGFYRAVKPGLLVVGPYQGGHGCLRIPFSRGVCGAAARTGRTQRIDDVRSFPDHIACSATTRSEIVVPIVSPAGSMLAVLDVDSNRMAAFDEVDELELERLGADLASRFPNGGA